MTSPLSPLSGTWRGRGAGQFPTMEPFEYEEEVRFTDLGVPAFRYRQHAWSPDDGGLLHLESGIWRAGPDGTLAVTIALPRVSEISEGSINESGSIRLATTSVARAAGGATLVAVRRAYQLDGDVLTYEIFMATEGVPEVTRHLVGSLHRLKDGDEPARSAR